MVGGGSAHLPEAERRTRVEARTCFGRVTPAHVKRDVRERKWMAFIQLWSVPDPPEQKGVAFDDPRRGHWALVIKSPSHDGRPLTFTICSSRHARSRPHRMGLGTSFSSLLISCHPSPRPPLIRPRLTHRRRREPTATIPAKPRPSMAGSSRCAAPSQATRTPAAPASTRCARPPPSASTGSSTPSSSAAVPRAASSGSSPDAARAPVAMPPLVPVLTTTAETTGTTTARTVVATTDTTEIGATAATTARGRMLPAPSPSAIRVYTSLIASSPTTTAMARTWRVSSLGGTMCGTRGCS